MNQWGRSGPTRPARRGRARPAVLGALAVGSSLLAAAPAVAEPLTVGYAKTQVLGAGVWHPTSLDFGPDGKLYVAQQNGVIQALTVARTSAGAYTVTGKETISNLVSGPDALPNHDDDGKLSTTPGRLVTGVLAAGTAAAPAVYVTSSDPRIGGGVGATAKGDKNLDTNSGVVSRLTRAGAGWKAQHLVRGLPRSEENHTANGMALSVDGTQLYVAQGGHTNNGAPSSGFAGLPEYALSAAILRVDLGAAPIAGGGTYDLPTLNRPAGSLPFGGNNGLTQAKLVPGGPVQVHAPGVRNPYDIVRLQGSSKLLTIDNGGNKGWGNLPVGEGTPACQNAEQTALVESNKDELFDVTTPGTYAGHPNPTRGSTANTFGGASPVSSSNPVECDFRLGAAANALASFPTSTNGLTQYTSSLFGGAMQGDLLTVDYANVLWRVELNGTAPATTTKLLSAAVVDKALDVAVPEAGPLDGTIWLADYGNWSGSNDGGLWVVEPADLGGAAGPVCDPAKADSDGDGYTNADEQAAGTNPCAKGDVPPDFDGDGVSDRTDADDDGDGTPDVVDAFARDAKNGLGNPLPHALEFENDDGGGGEPLKVGFTGLMTNGVTNYLDQFSGANMTVGGAAGLLTVDKADPGDAAVGNKQKYAFQFGVVPGTAPFTVHARVVDPFTGRTPVDQQSMGVFLGTGGQDDYVKLVTASNCGTIVQAFKEVAGATGQARQGLALPTGFVDLYLRVDPVAGTVQPSFTAQGGPRVNVGGPIAVPKAWFTSPAKGLAVGIVSTSIGSAEPQGATWDFVRVTPGEPGGTATSPAPPAPACKPVTAPGPAVPKPPAPKPPAPKPPTPKPPTAKPGTDTKGAGTTDRVRPTLTGLRLARTTFRTRGRTRGTTVRFRLSEQASVRLTVTRATTGRRVGGSCQKATRANRGARTCTRWVAVRGRLAQPVAAGRRSLTFTGRLDGRALAPGRYRMALVATDAAGNRSAPARAAFRVVR